LPRAGGETYMVDTHVHCLLTHLSYSQRFFRRLWASNRRRRSSPSPTSPPPSTTSSTTTTTMLSRFSAIAVRRGRVAPVFTARMYAVGSQMSNEDPKTLEREKERTLHRKQTLDTHDHAPGWNESLASESEAHVKADQANIDPSTLPERTIAALHQQHSADEGAAGEYATTHTTTVKTEVDVTSRTDSSDPSVTSHTQHEHALNERDEVEGPLARKGDSLHGNADRETVEGPLGQRK